MVATRREAAVAPGAARNAPRSERSYQLEPAGPIFGPAVYPGERSRQPCWLPGPGLQRERAAGSQARNVLPSLHDAPASARRPGPGSGARLRQPHAAIAAAQAPDQLMTDADHVLLTSGCGGVEPDASVVVINTSLPANGEPGRRRRRHPLRIVGARPLYAQPGDLLEITQQARPELRHERTINGRSQ